jgi:hypothetical protein
MAQLMRLARSPFPLPLGSLGARRSLLALENLSAAIEAVLAAPGTRARGHSGHQLRSARRGYGRSRPTSDSFESRQRQDAATIRPAKAASILGILQPLSRPEVCSGSSLCENSARYKRTLNFEACGRAESRKTRKTLLRWALKSNQVFAQPGSNSAAEHDAQQRQVLHGNRTPRNGIVDDPGDTWADTSGARPSSA